MACQEAALGMPGAAAAAAAAAAATAPATPGEAEEALSFALPAEYLGCTNSGVGLKHLNTSQNPQPLNCGKDSILLRRH
jgi:TctA family transporter